MKRYGRIIRLLRDEIAMLQDFPEKAEGGPESVEERARELEEAIEILGREGEDA